MAFRNSNIRRDKVQFKVKFSFFSSLSFPFLLILFFLVVLPFFFIAFYSFVNVRNDNIYLTIDNFARFLSTPGFYKVLGRSLWYAVICTVICIILAYPFAYFMAKCGDRMRNVMNMLITLPMWTNLLLRVVAWKQILDEGGLFSTILSLLGFGEHTLLGTDFAVILVMVYVYLPFMILPIYNQLLKIHKNLKEASMDLGASSFKTFYKVIFPLSMPGVISGFTMVFLPAATSLIVPRYMSNGDPSFTFIGPMIESFFINANNRYAGSAIAVILAIVIVVSTYIINKADRTVVKDRLPKPAKTVNPIATDEERAAYEKTN